MKTDRVDAVKLASVLKANLLMGKTYTYTVCRADGSTIRQNWRFFSCPKITNYIKLFLIE